MDMFLHESSSYSEKKLLNLLLTGHPGAGLTIARFYATAEALLLRRKTVLYGQGEATIQR